MNKKCKCVYIFGGKPWSSITNITHMFIMVNILFASKHLRLGKVNKQKLPSVPHLTPTKLGK